MHAPRIRWSNCYLAILYTLWYGICYYLAERYEERPPYDDDVLKEYNPPFQPIPIVADGLNKVVLLSVLTFFVISGAVKEKTTPHVSHDADNVPDSRES